MTRFRIQSPKGAKQIHFTFNGKSYQGFEGEPLAAALLANGVHLIGRSFKFHRPRGIYSAGSAEPNALVTVLHPDGREPNTLATTLEIYKGLEAVSQNCWPSVETDFGAVNSLLSPLFVAGFYYKTFMGKSNKHWMFFEKYIRKAAGMGEASVEADKSVYEKTNTFCDYLIVGAGPAGISAALEAAQTGKRVVLADEQDALGASLIGTNQTIDGLLAGAWLAQQLATLKTYPNVTLLPRTTIYGYYDDNTLGAVERINTKALRERHIIFHADKVILATGAIERPIVFGNNDRPGVMLASGFGTYVKRHHVRPGTNVIAFTNNDSIYQQIDDAYEAGATVHTVVDMRQSLSDYAQEIVTKTGINVQLGKAVSHVLGSKKIRAVQLDDGTKLSCDLLIVSGGWTPTINLQSQQGDKPIYDDSLCAFVPGLPHQDYLSVGACNGQFSLADCLKSGARALGQDRTYTVERDAPWDILPVWEVPATKGIRFVDFQHDVKASDISLAKREGFISVEHLKRYTTLGMANDQGKTSNLNALALMAKERQKPITEVGTTRFRPPYTPVAIGTLSGGKYGDHFRPTRYTPMHEWHINHGAEMINTGAWVRPRVYKQPGETVTDAYIREAASVRNSVGMVDVTTLGKIEVVGPDAPEFLNRVYTNAWLKLPVGKARYGVMLRDDGLVFDDGTTWRLEENRFLMTTTTANAANVLTHLEYLLDVVWPGLKVKVISVTDQWAGVAVAGPNSRATIAKTVSGVDMSHEAFPFMAVMDGFMDTIPVKIARLSFSGELAYEVWCPSHYGLAMWEKLFDAGKEFNLTPYGTEALGTLRIEKGHVSGPELDGRTSLDDLGLSWAFGKKDFVGKPLSQREGLMASDRAKLVGLMSKPGQAIRPGSQIVTQDDQTRSIGHVTSTTYSPALQNYIALALIQNGRDKIGDTVIATYPLKNEQQDVEIVHPHFFDPDGSRMHV
ncbi:sarcosine oxidase subunit alpha family protein [Terasakiella pusilla]|uniref:sarcosine oxidase subunit alpha family protein n=1 Tax=Terasakiella pusilla TaxID=64973 RepID=UPI003AA8A63F